MAQAKRGFAPGDGLAAGSVDGVIVIVPVFLRSAAIGLGEIVFVEDGVGHDVALCGPRAQVHQSAAIGAERKVRVRGGVSRFLANRATVLHFEETVLPSGRYPDKRRENVKSSWSRF